MHFKYAIVGKKKYLLFRKKVTSSFQHDYIGKKEKAN